MSNIIPRYGATQSLLCIALETKPLVFASLTSDRRQIVVRVCQHPASPVQCKQPQVIMKTVLSDYNAAGEVSGLLIRQRALALQFKIWRLGNPWRLQSDSGRAGRTVNKMYIRCNVRFAAPHNLSES